MGILTFILVLGTVAILNPSSYRFPVRPSQTRAPFLGLSCLVSLRLQKPHRLPKASRSRSLWIHCHCSNLQRAQQDEADSAPTPKSVPLANLTACLSPRAGPL